MKSRIIPAAAFGLLLIAGCVPYYADYPRAYEPTPTVVEVPVLPPQVILETRPYYTYRGYHYYWHPDHNVWLYSHARKGPWYRLPRSHYPQRFQYKGRWHEGERERDRDYDRDRDRDRGRGRDRDR
jgi:hypothetical protein